jgi:hypothetical protein
VSLDYFENYNSRKDTKTLERLPQQIYCSSHLEDLPEMEKLYPENDCHTPFDPSVPHYCADARPSSCSQATIKGNTISMKES